MITLPDMHFTWLHVSLMTIDGKQIMLEPCKMHVSLMDVVIFLYIQLSLATWLCVVCTWRNMSAEMAQYGLETGLQMSLNNPHLHNLDVRGKRKRLSEQDKEEKRS